MAKSCPTVAKSQVQTVFAMLEDVSGILQPPASAGYIQPDARATLNQTPEYADSTELSPSLNTVNQFQGAMPVGEVSLSMFLRLNADYSKPQGDALLVSLLGDYNDPTLITAEIDTVSGISATDTEITLSSVRNQNVIDNNILKDKFPPCGVVKIGSEHVLYQNITYAQDGTPTLSGCKRGYHNTTSVEHVDADAVQLLSRVYTQSVCRPTATIWIMDDDKLLRGMSGCAVTQGELTLTKDAAGQKLAVSLQGRRMVWSGCGELAEAPTGAKVKLAVGGADAYTEGGYVRNKTKADDNNGSGYRIMAVDDENDIITLSATPTGWQTGDRLYPWLPSAKPVGTALESRTANVQVGGVAGKMNDGTLTYACPVSFVSEIGDDFPGEGVDTKRTITLNRSVNFRAEDGVELGKGYKGYEMPVTVLAGKLPGLTMAFYMPRVKFNTPEVGDADNVLTLTQNGTALGVTGEDAFYIIQE